MPVLRMLPGKKGLGLWISLLNNKLSYFTHGHVSYLKKNSVDTCALKVSEFSRRGINQKWLRMKQDMIELPCQLKGKD